MIREEYKAFHRAPLPADCPNFKKFNEHAEWCVSWWRNSAKEYPTLSLLVLQVYATPISSAAVEIVFSTVTTKQTTNFDSLSLINHITARNNLNQLALMDNPEAHELMYLCVPVHSGFVDWGR